ncbi:MAG: HEAT repeat domain-containing protein [Pseudomonadota bacterium]
MMAQDRGLVTKRFKASISAIVVSACLLADTTIAETTSSKAASLIQALQNADMLTQPSIVLEIESLGADAVPSLIAVMKAGDKFARHRSIEILGRLGETAKPAIPGLIDSLTDPEAQIRRNTAWALGRIGPIAKDALPDLLSTSQDPEWDVRADAFWALGKISSERDPENNITSAVLARLVEGLEDVSLHVRWSAIWALARLGPRAEAAVPSLISRLEDPVAKIRASAALSLARVAPADQHLKVVPALLAAKADPAPIVQSRAVAALRTFQRRVAPVM